MNPMIETFGALVGKAAAKSPDRARRLLELRFMPPTSRPNISPLVN